MATRPVRGVLPIALAAVRDSDQNSLSSKSVLQEEYRELIGLCRKNVRMVGDVMMACGSYTKFTINCSCVSSTAQSVSYDSAYADWL